MSRAITQPLKWHGGKHYLAAFIHETAPDSIISDPASGYTHRNIVYAGGMAELWNWAHEGIAEAANDINHELTNFWRVLQSPAMFDEFARKVNCTPFSQVEFASITAGSRSAVEQAVRFFIRYRQSRQGLGRDYATPTQRRRGGMHEGVSAWLSAVDGLPEAHARLRRVEIRCLDAVRFIRRYDHARAHFYVDPPYVHSTRRTTGEYDHEMSEDDHRDLLDTLAGIAGTFQLSGYRSELYDAAADRHGWRRLEKLRPNAASGSRTKQRKLECIWCNY